MRHWLGAALWLGGLCAHAEPAFRIGAAMPDIARQFGPPTRMIEANEGLLLFYGPTLLYVTNGIVDFVSVGGLPPPRSDASPPATLAARPPDLDPSPAWAPPPPRTREHLTPLPRLDAQARLEQDRRQQRIAGRIKRVAINQGYAALRADFLRGASGADTDHALPITDARGRPCPTFGDSADGALHGLGLQIQTLVFAR